MPVRAAGLARVGSSVAGPADLARWESDLAELNAANGALNSVVGPMRAAGPRAAPGG